MRRESKADIIFLAVNYVFLTLVLLIIAYPIIYIVSSSFSSGTAVSAGKVWLFPVEFSLEGYKAIFKSKNIVQSFINTVIYTVGNTTLAVVLTIMAAYPLSRKDLKGKGIFMFLFTFTMLFSGGLIPNYLLMQDLHLINTRWAMIIPFVISAYNVIITRTFYQANIPDELLEAAQLDGCGDVQFILKVVLPLSHAITAVIALFYAVGNWNSFFNAFVYLNDPKMQPLQIVLREILVLNTADMSMTSFETITARASLRELLKYSLIIVSSVPIICVYPFVQKYFVKGVMIGALKG